MFWLWTWGSTVFTRPTPSCWDQSPVGATSSGTECLVRVAVVLYTFSFFFWILVKPGSSQKTSSNKPKPKNTSTILRAEIKHLQGGLLMKFSFPTKTKRLSHLCNFNPKLDSSLRQTLYFWLQKMQKNNKPNVTLMCSGNDECVQH